MTAEQQFAINLKTLRFAKQTTQKSVSKKLGVSLATYRNWEYGKFTPKIEVLKNICQYYGVTAQSMLTERIGL